MKKIKSGTQEFVQQLHTKLLEYGGIDTDISGYSNDVFIILVHGDIQRFTHLINLNKISHITISYSNAYEFWLDIEDKENFSFNLGYGLSGDIWHQTAWVSWLNGEELCIGHIEEKACDSYFGFSMSEEEIEKYGMYFGHAQSSNK